MASKSDKKDRPVNPRLAMKAASGVALSRFKENDKDSRPAPQFHVGAGRFKEKITDRRQSSNVEDRRPKKSDLFQATNSKDDHLRQIFNPKVSKSLTKVSNRIVRADPQNAKGKGMTKLRSPAPSKVQYNIFSKKKGS